jgi:predicted ferric reductase
MSNTQKDKISPSEEGEKSLNLILLALAAGILVSLYFFPQIVPSLATSIFGPNPKIFWYLARGSAFVAFWLLWLSMALGLALTGRVAKAWPGVLQAVDLHEFVSLLGLGAALFHGLILTGDRYIQYTPLQVLLPFAGQSYEPIWVGIGQVAFYVWAIITLSFYVRKRIGTQTWRLIHLISFLAFAMALVHGIASGTDSGTLWAGMMYWISGGSLIFLLAYRILARLPVFSMQKAS